MGGERDDGISGKRRHVYAHALHVRHKNLDTRSLVRGRAGMHVQ